MKNIREIRRCHLRRLLDGYPTQRQFAEATDLSPAHISQMLTANREIGSNVARRIENSLGLTPGTMDCAEQPESIDLDMLLKQALTSDKLKLLHDYDTLSPKHQEMVREMAAACVMLEKSQQQQQQ